MQTYMLNLSKATYWCEYRLVKTCDSPHLLYTWNLGRATSSTYLSKRVCTSIQSLHQVLEIILNKEIKYPNYKEVCKVMSRHEPTWGWANADSLFFDEQAILNPDNNLHRNDFSAPCIRTSVHTKVGAIYWVQTGQNLAYALQRFFCESYLYIYANSRARARTIMGISCTLPPFLWVKWPISTLTARIQMDSLTLPKKLLVHSFTSATECK